MSRKWKSLTAIAIVSVGAVVLIFALIWPSSQQVVGTEVTVVLALIVFLGGKASSREGTPPASQPPTASPQRSTELRPPQPRISSGEIRSAEPRVEAGRPYSTPLSGYLLGELVGWVKEFGMVLIGIVVVVLFGVGFNIAVGDDHPIGFRQLNMTGDQPQIESQKTWRDAYRQYTLTYHLSTSSMIHTTFEVPPSENRLFLHAGVRLLNDKTTCSNPTRLDYRLNSDGQTIISGALALIHRVAD
jgi:hypothetical protein